ncbi:uncharacterized protein LOC117792051 [Drosophila innubila]|uniref:uncharacterized protein LOC117792051 n=1 Tax=Drosophila innubila TaxID=198719 RepID=UPI00148D7BC1|nr:uncharacterized protein LOC117792051 [Drosophila innubila]
MEDNSYSQLIEESIKLHFERNGTLDEMRSGLHVKVLKMLHDQKKLRKDEPLCGGELERRGLSHLLNQLIVDYFDWYGYKHTLETFSLETGIKSKKSREKLRRELNGNFDHKELPILLEMLMKQTNRDYSNQSEENQAQHVLAKVETTSSNSKKVPGPSLVVRELQQPEKKAPRPSSRAVESPIKVDKLHRPITPINYAPNSQAKVHVRQRMTEVVRKVPSNPKKVGKKSPEIAKPTSYDTDTASDSTKSSTEDDDNDTEESETFADIPNRYYYREQEPPERTYPHGYGEEGPYEGQHLQKPAKPLNSRKVEKSKAQKFYEMENKERKLKSSSKDMPKSPNTKSKTSDQSTSKRSRFLYQSFRRVNHSDDDLNMPVSKPKCPETVISSIKMDSADDSDEDSDVYL